MRSHGILIKAGAALLPVLFSILVSYPSDIFARDTSMLSPLPAAEAETVITRWLMDAGFETNRLQSKAGLYELKALKGSEVWRIIIKPYSPLASYVTAEYTLGGRPDTEKVRGLQKFIDSWEESVNSDIPGSVLTMKEYTVCIRAGTAEAHIQFSGFIVGKEGLIVTIAHDLDEVREVAVVLNNGEELKGRVIRMDFDRDLSLIDIDREIHSPISLTSARNLLETGETVYSIGCAGNDQSGLHAGIINGPPGMVNNIPLWQVKMETPHGTSGGPVFDTHGNLVGVVKGRYRGTNSRGFLITAETLIDFLKER